MLDLKAISEMNTTQWCNYIASLSNEEILTNQAMLIMAHGFILCKALYTEYSIPKENINNAFYEILLNSAKNKFETLFNIKEG